MKSNKSKSVVVLIGFIILSLLSGYVVFQGIGSQHKGKAKNIKLGLDLAGGVSITYQVKKENPTDAEMNDTVYKLQKRVEQYSTEANVYKDSKNRINVEIPGVTDANKILEELGKPGTLEFKDESGKTVLTGSDIKTADGNSSKDQTTGATEYIVNLEMTKDGTTKFAKATKENVGKRISIVYDNKVVSSPTVNEEISGGQAQIDGQESIEEAKELASLIRIGALPLELEELRSNVVAAQLGSKAVNSSVKAGAIGVAIVCVFMIAIYLFPGFVASLALIGYVLLMLLALNGFNVTLTLPGMAGIILGIGMAVDANVIIFTRIKEEIRDGKSVKTAIGSGFHKALSAILDGNITTLIAAAVLWIKGSGTVKGFAQTLGLGVILSMFTALVISKLLINAFYTLGVNKPALYGKAKNTKVFGYVKISKFCIVASVIVILIGLIFLPVNKKKTGSILKFDLDFVGGTATTLTLDKHMDTQEAEDKLIPIIAKEAGIKESTIQVQATKKGNQVVIKSSELNLSQREKVESALKKAVTIKSFESENIDATISNEMRQDAVIAILIATICMLIYIGVRFKDWKFGTAAVLALLHDVLVLFTLYSVCRLTVGTTFIACMLTIVGYSINATIIIFDRIRENLRNMSVARDGLECIVNTSISQTFTRTINTSITTIIMVFVLWLMGVSSIREFALAIMVGLVCGAYSSVCITGPVWYVLKKNFDSNVKKVEAKRGAQPATATTTTVNEEKKITANPNRKKNKKKKGNR